MIDLPPQQLIHTSHQASCQMLFASSVFERLKQFDPSLNIEDMKVIEMKQVTWNNGALGCPIEGMCYTQALVEGYCIWIQHQHLIFEVHTDASFQSVALPGIGFIPIGFH